FQAEDGIRDYKVTGVQTCALPIYLSIKIAWFCWGNRSSIGTFYAAFWPTVIIIYERSRHGWIDRRNDRNQGPAACRGGCKDPARSEERRVGKECRYRRWRYQ